ncbi:hypothetical protein [Nitrosospira sp. Is2]|uniref:hypothetical protein n=1 Tax=Nitrosospira sp. Is2 TaxID=3080532 RepID=UPI0029543F14|nr:hypothetical protein [Nitrosospira sp. Is2]WON73812.1 hypothetical protein R5L00_15225 [Nitrosospira sp. Is2]
MKQSLPGKPDSHAGSRSVLGRAVISGTVGGLAAAAAASLAGKREDDHYAAPLNATSHIIWGDEAAYQDKPSLKYTLTGFLLNHASAIFWAIFYEKLLGRGESRADQGALHPTNWNEGPLHDSSNIASQARPMLEPILDAAAVTAAAYVTDYYLVPKRFTPGFEKRLSGKSLFAVFVALAAGLAARDVIRATKAPRK